MDNSIDSTVTSEDSLESLSPHVKAASAPAFPILQAALKEQISAPCYFHSLKENDAPPFQKPAPDARPLLVIGTVMNEEEAIEMIATADSDRELGLKMFLGKLLLKKEVIPNYCISEKNFLVSFLMETVDYAAQHDFSAFKLACLITIYVKSHMFFKAYYWHAPASVWNYFKEIMIRHTIEDSPDGQEVFEPDECYDILTHFHMMYLSNLPLVHILTFGAYRLKLGWPFKMKV